MIASPINSAHGPWRHLSPGGGAIDLIAACLLAILLLDRPVALFFHGLMRHLMIVLTGGIPDLGHSWPLFVLGFIALVAYRLFIRDRERSEKALFVLGAGALSGLCADVLKVVFGRMRPSAFINEDLYQFDLFNLTSGFDSFPSSNAAVAAGLASSLSVIAPGGRVLFMHLAAAIAAVRVITCDHFVSDALFGFGVGLFGGWVLRLGFQRLNIQLSPANSVDRT